MCMTSLWNPPLKNPVYAPDIYTRTKNMFKNEQKVGMLLQKRAKLKVWMTIVDSGWNVWVWLVGVVGRAWVWLVGVGGIYGCG